MPPKRRDGRLVLVPASLECQDTTGADGSSSDPISDPGSFSSDDVPPEPTPPPASAKVRSGKPSKERSKKQSTVLRKRPKPVHPTKGQKNIFDFAVPIEEGTVDADPFFQTVIEIYNFFNRKKKIPVILSAIHQSGGNVGAAVTLLTNGKDGEDVKIDFQYKTVTSGPEDAERYFKN
jgi:hypothetical protein